MPRPCEWLLVQTPPGELEEGGEEVKEQVRVAREVRRRGPRLLARDDVTPAGPVKAPDAGALRQLCEGGCETEA